MFVLRRCRSTKKHLFQMGVRKLILKSLTSILLEDLQRLLDNKVPEGRTLEYKREPPGNSDAEKIKFLRAVSAMANTEGGDLIYGIEEDAGIPACIIGIPTAIVDHIKLRFEQLLQTNVEPRIPSVQIRSIQIDAETCVLVVRAHRSWLKPHRVAVGNHVHFYARNSAQTYQMDVSQLREAFLLSDQQADRVRTFVVDRLLRLEQKKTPVRLETGAKPVIHLIPVSALARHMPQQLDVSRLERTSFPLFEQQMSRSHKPNLDGFVVYDTPRGESQCYTQVFRNGIIEAVVSLGPLNGEKILVGSWLEKRILDVLDRSILQLTNRGLDTPFIVSLSFVDVDGYQLDKDERTGRRDPLKYPEGVLVLPDVLIEDASGIGDGRAMRPVFDAMWNAFEYDGSPHYDENGFWRHR